MLVMTTRPMIITRGRMKVREIGDEAGQKPDPGPRSACPLKDVV